MNARIAPPAPIDPSPDAITRSARTVIATEAAAVHALEWPRVWMEFFWRHMIIQAPLFRTAQMRCRLRSSLPC